MKPNMKAGAIHQIGHKVVVVGSGASGLNAASRLRESGVDDVCLISEHLNAGTSRNTGSDKQTYYKLSLSGSDEDSVGELAGTLASGGCVDGDLALVEAALSARCFFRLVELGVPFPRDRFGQYVGYKTDHDPKRRATSAGPYTSKMMTEALEREARERGVEFLDKMQVIRILQSAGEIRGLLCLDTSRLDDAAERYAIITCDYAVWATGGPAGIYADSVYPYGQYGSSGLAFEAGVSGQNLTEWQYGLASLRPRWNVSGSYMQVLPRFFSTDASGGDERGFLDEYFRDHSEKLSTIFLKGYQWPFDVSKASGGSSILDILVYIERRLKGRKVFLDFRSNEGGGLINWGALSAEARAYLEKAGACGGTPVERLKRLNGPAYSFYRDRGVDLEKAPLEIALSAQHNNGGLKVDANWRTEIKGFYAVGEAAGTHGVHRPGGSALNAGQAGSLRAALDIAAEIAEAAAQNGGEVPSSRSSKGLTSDIEALARATIELGEGALTRAFGQAAGGEAARSPEAARQKAAARMSSAGAAFRSRPAIEEALAASRAELDSISEIAGPRVPSELPDFFRLRDCLISQLVYLSAMKDYIAHGGKSRGSALYADPCGTLPRPSLSDSFRFLPDTGEFDGYVQETRYEEGECGFSWRPVRPIPSTDDFFENVWKEFRERELRG